MQPPHGRRRPIEQSSVSKGPLVYARLSHPILVKRAKDGPAPEADRADLRGELNRYEAASMPIGTGKWYAHRCRNRLRDRLEDVA